MGLFSPAYSVGLSLDTYTSGSYTQATNKSGHIINEISGSARFTSKTTNEAGATITSILGEADFTNFTNEGSVGSISGDAGFGGLNNFGKIGSISSAATSSSGGGGSWGGGGLDSWDVDFLSLGSSGKGVAVGTLINGALNATAANAYIGEISGGTFGDYDYYSSGYASFMGCDVPRNCVLNSGTIDKISGGTFSALANVAVAAQGYTGRVNSITGGTFEQLQNEGYIGTISGGTFKENAYAYGQKAIKNYGTIDNITDKSDITNLVVGSGYTGISANWGDNQANTGTGRINTISGGQIQTLDIETESGFDKASIGTILGGSIITLNNGTAAASGGGIIENISGGTIKTLNNRANSSVGEISNGNVQNL